MQFCRTTMLKPYQSKQNFITVCNVDQLLKFLFFCCFFLSYEGGSKFCWWLISRYRGCRRAWAGCRKTGSRFASGWPGSCRRWRLCPRSGWTAVGPARSPCPGQTWGWRSASHWTAGQRGSPCPRWAIGSSRAPGLAPSGSWAGGCSLRWRAAPSGCPRDSAEGESRAGSSRPSRQTQGPRAQGVVKISVYHAPATCFEFTCVPMFNPQGSSLIRNSRE